MTENYDWSSFYDALGNLGPRFLEGIDEVTAIASEGYGSITIKAIEGSNINRLWQEIKSEVDRIQTFPDESEEPNITIAARKREVLKIALYGDASELVKSFEE